MALLNSNNNNQNKSQAEMMQMLGENDENGVRIRFRGGRSRRSHASGGNNGSSSHRSRPKVSLNYVLLTCSGD